MLLRPVTFKNTQSVRITRALNNWLAEPNNGQIFAYPILVRMNPHTNVTIVEKYVLHNNFLHPSACSISSTLKSSWKLIRPIRATASSDVRASADTHIVINTVAKCTGTPNISKKPATPRLKIWNGVPVAAVPSAAAPSDVDAAKQDIVARTNALRAEHGIAALTADDQLMRAAQVRADEMAATGAYSHTRPDGRKYYTVTDCRQVWENIHQIPLLYLAQQKTALAETLVYSWSKSAGHMENMTDESYAAIGVGLARGTDANGLECWYCVQLFLRSGYSISAVDKPATK